jgi:Flp pilus assembly protein TadG
MTRRWDSDDGNALVEFTYLSVLLMIPLVYVLLSVFLVQRAAFGTTEAARQAGRAYTRAASVDQAEARGAAAAMLALKDQGVTDAGPPVFECLGGPCLTPGSRVRVTISYRVRLPLLGAVFGHGAGGTIPVTATHTEYVDRFKVR